MHQFASCIIPLIKINAGRAWHSREQGRSRWIVLVATIVSSASCIPGSTSAQTPNTPANITAAFSGKCFEVSDMSTADGAPIVQHSCTGAANQQWTLRPYLDAYQLIAKHSGKCLAVQDASKSDGAKAIQLSCTNQDSQAWYAWQYGSGFELAARHSSKCLAVSNASHSDGAQVVQSTCDHNADQLLSIAGSGIGVWGPVIAFPLVPAAAANLPDGRILVWAAEERTGFGADGGRTYTAIFDPANSSVTLRLVSETGHDMFCPGVSLLFDGGVFVTGGLSSAKTSIYNPATDSWSAGPQMNIPRGYQASTTLPNGGVFTVGGSWSGGLGNKNGEVWTSGAGWKLLPGVLDDPLLGPDPAGIYRADNHMWLFAVANNRVLQAGPSADMHWIDTGGKGRISSAGSRGNDAYSMNGNAVLYDIGKLLKIGGAPAYENANATNSAYVININSGIQVRAVEPMAYSRAMHNSVVLPSGQVVVVGGQAVPIPFSDDRSVLVPELWDPTSETFTTMAPMQVPRNYHSVALLLLDGRVFSAGGGLCGGCATNHYDAQIFTPPYLLNFDGTPATQPKIVSAPSSAALGKSIRVTTDSAVTSFVLMRMGSSTHSVNTDQRRVPLKSTSVGSNAYSVTIPSDPGVALPGYYMLFALDNQGVPSVAKSVQITTKR